jgi:hypothetical protein
MVLAGCGVLVGVTMRRRKQAVSGPPPELSAL